MFHNKYAMLSLRCNALEIVGGAAAAGKGKAKAAASRPATAPVKRAATGTGKTAGAAPAEGEGAADDGSSGGAVPAVRAVTLSPDFRRLLVGTQTCEILEYTLPGNGSFATLDAAVAAAHAVATQVVCGHFKDEVWGLAIRPVTPEGGGKCKGCEGRKLLYMLYVGNICVFCCRNTAVLTYLPIR